MDKCGKRFVQFFLEKNEDLIDVEMQDCLSRFTNDVIASSVFGAEVDSLKDPDNEFYLRGKQTTDLKFPKNLKMICWFAFPSLYKVSNFPYKQNRVFQFSAIFLVTWTSITSRRC